MLRNEFILLVAVLVATASAASIDPRCTRYSLGMEAQVLSYEQDCRKFVICDMGGNGQVLSCPPGLYFSDESHACSFDMTVCTHGELDAEVPNRQPVEVPLPSRPIPSQPEIVVPELAPLPVVPVQPQEPDLIPMPVPNEPELEESSSEEASAEVDANRLPIITAAPTTEASAEDQPEAEAHLPQQSVCWDKAAGNVYPVANDCGLYVVCLGGNDAIVQRCPKGLLYDHKQQRCEFADTSYCATPRIDGHVLLDVHGVDLKLYGDETYAIPVVEEKEDRAVEVEPVQQHQEHQPILMVPVEPEPEPMPVVEYNFRIIDNHPRCLARTNLDLTAELPHDTDCSKYYVCVGRVAIEKQCPAGQHWSAANQWCDFVSRANCAL